MVRAWRLAKTRHAAAAFDGEGARRFGGRWNSKGVAVAYASSSLSLAALEVVVHMPGSAISAYSVVIADFGEHLIEDLPRSVLPADWKEYPAPSATQGLGDRWVAEGRSLVLRVPSVIVETEHNFLVNVSHPDFNRIRIAPPVPFDFDPRLLPKGPGA